MTLDCRLKNVVREDSGWTAWVEFFDTDQPEVVLPKGKRAITAASQTEFETRLDELWQKAQAVYDQMQNAQALAQAAIDKVRTDNQS